MINIKLPSLVYHGTTTEHLLSLKNINFEKCNKFTDFGIGFYTTSNYSQAYSFANMKAKEHNTYEYNIKLKCPDYNINLVKPIVFAYSININKLSRMNGYIFHKPDKKWAEFIYNNRLEDIKISDFYNTNKKYDFCYGYMGDSIIVPLLLDIRNGKIGFNEFYKKIQPFDKNQNQLSFHTYKALNCIKNINVNI
jgi:hypothetical protein